jgi:dienelactone hydrolase
MTTIALFHSALGVRSGIHEAADLLRSHGHTVHVIDQYDGAVFDDYEAAMELVTQIGFPALMAKAIEATSQLPRGFVTVGFSNGGGMAEYVAASTPEVSGVVMLAGALDPSVIGVTWPAGVPGQIHYTEADPMRSQSGIDAVVAAARAVGADVETFDYPGSGHLFADSSKADEFQPAEAELMWSRVLAFLNQIDAHR